MPAIELFLSTWEKSDEDTCNSISHVSVIPRNILTTIIRVARYWLLLASDSTLMTDPMYLDTIQICLNLNENYWYLISTTFLIWQIDAHFSPFQSLNMLSFNIRLERYPLGLISHFSKCYFKTGTICLLFLSPHIFKALQFDSNHSGVLLWKIVQPRYHNEIKPPTGIIFRKYKPIRHYFVMSRKWLSCSFVNKVHDIVTRYPTSEGIKNGRTWKPLFRRKSIFLSKLDLSEAVTRQLFKPLSLRL